MANYRRVFLDGYSYFLTVVTHRRNPILVEHIDILRESFRESKRFYHYSIDSIVVLPDHFHMIITPQEPQDYPKIIKSIKYNFTKRYKQDDIEQSSSRHKREMRAVWQKRYYEHTIRDDRDYERCLEYIYHNPLKHEYISDGEDWKYSSFYRGLKHI
jgi:putative transposase